MNDISEKNIMNVKKLSILNREIKNFIEYGEDALCVIKYIQTFGKPSFKVTLEMIDEDFIIDEKGRKWVREKYDE